MSLKAPALRVCFTISPLRFHYVPEATPVGIGYEADGVGGVVRMIRDGRSTLTFEITGFYTCTTMEAGPNQIVQLELFINSNY